MTANNCDRCRYGDNGSASDGCPETCLEPDYPDFDPEPVTCSRESAQFAESVGVAITLLALETENAQLTQRLANVINNNRELMFERDTLRESEAKAWGLVEAVDATVDGFIRSLCNNDKSSPDREQRFRAWYAAQDAARAALAARKAGL